MKIIYPGLLGLLFLLISSFSQGQCALEPVSIEQRVEKSDLVLEGEITEQSCFFDEYDGHIYTSNKLEITKVFKGAPDLKTVTIITKGGIVGNSGEHIEPSLSLSTNNKGIFFLYQGRQLANFSENTFGPYSGPQAYIYYDEIKNTASDAFYNYGLIGEVFYTMITDQTGHDFAKVHALNLQKESNKSSAPDIQSVSPLSVRAGTRDVIEIRGSGFGSSRGSGKVEFKNASTGSANIEPAPDEYLTWTDELIEVEVPYQAGTGTIRVIQSGSDIFPGLVVRFAHLSLGTAQYPIPTLHLDNNTQGGFTWRMSTDFFTNSDAKASFERAMENWSDQTCINWENGSSTTTDQDRQDGINNVRFAETEELEQGVLAITRNYWGNCSADIAFTVEIDLSFDPDKAWNFDAGFPSFNEYDLESIAVHELGHAHQLGHVVDVSDFMHATIGPGNTKRILSDNNIEAGFHVMKLSVVKKPCGPREMSGKVGCNIPLSINKSVNDDSGISVYPNPFSNNLSIELNSNGGIISIYDLSGTKILCETTETNSFNWRVPNDLSNGIYMINLVSEKENKTVKVFLNR